MAGPDTVNKSRACTGDEREQPQLAIDGGRGEGRVRGRGVENGMKVTARGSGEVGGGGNLIMAIPLRSLSLCAQQHDTAFTS